MGLVPLYLPWFAGCCIVIVIAAAVHAAEQKFAIEPQDQTAIVGSKVTLPCRVINLSGALQWTKDDFALGNHRNLSEYGRYSMIGSDEEGDFSLAIESVTLEDNAKYQCQVGPGTRGEPGIRSRFATLTVLVPPQRPEILQGRVLTTTEDREIELECVSRDGKPAAELTWIDGLGNVVTQNAEYRIEPSLTTKLVTARSVLKITPKKEHHNTTFMCQAQNTAERIPQNAKLTLYVKYAPKVTIKFENGKQLVEGLDVRVTCHADANPPDVTYRWSLHERTVYPSNPTELVIRNISRHDNDAIVKCEAYNSVGKSEDSETLYILYGPRLRRPLHSVQAEQGSTVTLTCDVDSNPPAEISWRYAKTKELVGRSADLTVTVDEETAGKYYCYAYAAGFQEIVTEASILMKSRPIIKIQPFQFGTAGDTVQLECTAYSIPPPEKVIWSYNGHLLETENQPLFSEIRHVDKEIVRSLLIIREAQQEHFGSYNCSMSNFYGTDSAITILKPQKGFPLLLSLVGILGGVVIVVTVILITILCQRNVKKEPPPPPAIVIDSEKQCKDADRSSSDVSDIKMEVRTTSSISNNVNCDLDFVEDSRDTDTIITRVGTSLAGSIPPLDHRYTNNRFSSTDYPDPVFPPKTDNHSKNGYVPYVDYSRDYSPPPMSLHSLHHYPISSSMVTSGMLSLPVKMNALDLRYSATYGNPYLRNSNNPMIPPLPKTQPPPPPYCTLRNGSVPRVSKCSNVSSSQYIVANNTKPSLIKKGSLATHV